VDHLAHALEVAPLGGNDARVHHYGLEDHAGYLPAMLLEDPLQSVEIVVGNDQGEVGDGPRYPRA
jgi:hypothetical protein